jgi:hypothetical protein
MVLDIQTVHHILKNTAVQNVNKPFVYITDLTSTLTSRNISAWLVTARPEYKVSIFLDFFRGGGGGGNVIICEVTILEVSWGMLPQKEI